MNRYNEFCVNYRLANKFHDKNSDKDEFSKLVSQITATNHIKCLKYNHSLDPEGQTHMSFQSYLYFRGGTYTDLELIIMNRIPVEKNVEYVINSEP